MFDINKVFVYHPASPKQSDKYVKIRMKAKELAELLRVECPESRELALAFTSLQQSVMWANASIAIHEDK